MLIALSCLADTEWLPAARRFAANAVLMTVGFVLVGYQVAGYFVAAKSDKKKIWSNKRTLQQIEAPSKKAIVKATGIALVVALILLFSAVLPAEYGIDPLKTGALLHLTDLAKATESKPEPKPLARGP